MASLALADLINQPREFLGNQLVYAVITSRAHGLSIGVNMNPGQKCNFDCPYCEVRRVPEKAALKLNLKTLKQELNHVLTLAHSGQLSQYDQFSRVPQELLTLKDVTLSGDGEPSLVENFAEVVKEVLLIRQLTRPFKLVVITNGSGLQHPSVQHGLEQLSETDEIWIKLDAGTQAFMQQVNRTEVPLETILENILAVGRRRRVVIQSLFFMVDDEPPSDSEIEAYVQRLAELKAGGAQISLVQIYSVSRAPARPGCKHLPLAKLSQIARRVRAATDLKAEVF
jgi:wyosine [tRNA(Phe)-imidazoG37] synthetase (radical SAM superfamily)